MRYATIIKCWLYGISVLIILQSPNAESRDNFIAPPKIPSIDDIASTLTFSPSDKIVLGNLIVEFEHTTLDKIHKLAGTGTIQHQGDAGDSEYWLCYTTPSNEHEGRIWISSSELGGNRHLVNSIYIVANEKTIEQSAYCPNLPQHLRPISLGDFSLLGSSITKFTNRLGEPSIQKDNWWFYSYSKKNSSNNFNQVSILGAHINNEKIDGLFISQTTTN